jgi:hypothetical protein
MPLSPKMQIKMQLAAAAAASAPATSKSQSNPILAKHLSYGIENRSKSPFDEIKESETKVCTNILNFPYLISIHHTK